MQLPRIYPGFAILRFPAGIVTISLRISIVISLLVCLIASSVLLGDPDIIDNINSSIEYGLYYNFTIISLTAFWFVIVAAIALIFELIYFVFRFLNIRCYNNCYIAFGILDIVRYILLAMCLSVGLAGYAYGSDYAIDSARSCDRRSESMGEVDTACEELRDHAIILIVYTVLCGISVVPVSTSVVWEIIYLVAGFNSRLPVPRVHDDDDDDENKL